MLSAAELIESNMLDFQAGCFLEMGVGSLVVLFTALIVVSVPVDSIHNITQALVALAPIPADDLGQSDFSLFGDDDISSAVTCLPELWLISCMVLLCVVRVHALYG